MKFSFCTTAAVTTFTAIAFIASIAPADARIHCNGREQINPDGSIIGTPYCEDRYLFGVARSYGMSTSFNRIRFDVSEKERICRMIGHDSRIDDICLEYMPSGRRWSR